MRSRCVHIRLADGTTHRVQARGPLSAETMRALDHLVVLARRRMEVDREIDALYRDYGDPGA